jgi:hypothetical protein
LIIVGVNIGFQIKKFTQASQDFYARAGAIAEQAISGFRTVTSFSLQERFVQRYDERLIDAEKGDVKKGQAFGVGVGAFMFTLYGILGINSTAPPPHRTYRATLLQLSVNECI